MAKSKGRKPLCYRMRVKSVGIERDTDYSGKTFVERPTRTHFSLEFDGKPVDYTKPQMGISINVDGYAGVWDIKDVTAQVKLGDIFELRQISTDHK